jgi:ubiquinone/menaquinone biosynthesis C-methylase UbiE
MTTATSTTATSQGASDLALVKAKQQATWAAGDYAVIGTTLQIVGESLCEALDLRAGQRVLDVAAGNGNATLAAARRWCDVVSTDYVPALLERARARAGAEGLAVQFEQADAENLPYEDGAFDVVLSTFGVMFAPNQERAAKELMRVARPGGRIGLASWTPQGFIGRLFDLMSGYVPPPAGLRSPLAWGDETRLVELLGPQASDIRTERKAYVFRYRSPEHWLEFFRAYYGPTHKAFAALDEKGQQALEAALLDFLRSSNRSKGEALVIPGEYLEAVITK